MGKSNQNLYDHMPYFLRTWSHSAKKSLKSATLRVQSIQVRIWTVNRELIRRKLPNKLMLSNSPNKYLYGYC